MKAKQEWTLTQRQVLLDNIEKLSYREIGAMIGKSKDAVSQYCFQHKIRRSEKSHAKIFKRTNKTVFRKGEKPWNAGTKGLVKPNATSFQKGNTPTHTLPEYAISYKENKDGSKYKVIKIGARWIRLHRYNWEQLYGEIPSGYVIVFKDGDSLNCDPSNLECITKSEKMRREMAYVIKRSEARKRMQQESKNSDQPKKKLYIKKREVAVSNEIPVKVGRLTIFVKPGQDIEAIKKRYASLSI